MGIMSHLFNALPIQREKIVLYSFTETYADQPKYIAEELLRRQLPVRLVWVSEHKRVDTPRGIHSACGKYAARYHLATAGLIISNHRLHFYWPKGYRKKRGQFYLQTWHGSFGIKKMEADVPGSAGSAYLHKARLDSQHIDLLLSNCSWLTRIFRASFFYSGPILECGSPRNDILFAPGHTAARVRRALGLPADRKLLLYAPTFRDGAEGALPPALPDFAALRRALTTRFGGEWSILLRLHPGRRKRPAPLPPLPDHVQDVSHWPDAAELLAAADAMVSDYSSCIFDYLLTGRPAFIYAPDAPTYSTTRGLYYPLTDTPFPLAQNFLSLLFNVENFNPESYQTQVTNFLRARASHETGHAAECVVNHIADTVLTL